MKILKITALFLLSFSILFTSCEPENIDTTTETEEVEDRTENKLITRSNPVNGEGILLGCVSIPYPFSMVTINENVVEINSEDDFNSALEDTEDYIIDFVYPLTVVVDEEESIAESVEELGELFASCIPDSGWTESDFPAFLIDDTYCVSLVYPFNVTDIEENLIEVDSESAFVDLLAEYEILFFEFPFSVSNNESGEEIEVTTEEELFDALLNCEEVNQPCDTTIWGGQIACFDIVFPVSFILEDGTIEVVEDEEELAILLLEATVVGFEFPITLVNTETGEESTANNEDEFAELLFSCGFFQIIVPVEMLAEGNGECYDINYPLSILTYTGTVEEINNFEELEAYINQGASVNLPFSVTLPDGTVETFTAQNIWSFLQLLEDC